MVKVNGQALVAFNFDYNNVLAWREEAGCSAWLQFLVLPGGPVFVGKISHSAHDGVPSPRRLPYYPICGSSSKPALLQTRLWLPYTGSAGRSARRCWKTQVKRLAKPS